MHGHEITEAEKNEIMNSLEELFKKAEENKQWLYSKYTDIWFSPAELRLKIKEDKFIWGPPNWELRNPYERLNEYCAQIANIEKSKATFNDRIKASGL